MQVKHIPWSAIVSMVRIHRPHSCSPPAANSQSFGNNLDMQTGFLLTPYCSGNLSGTEIANSLNKGKLFYDMFRFLSFPPVLMYILKTVFRVKPKEKVLNYSFLLPPKIAQYGFQSCFTHIHWWSVRRSECCIPPRFSLSSACREDFRRFATNFQWQ